MNRNKLLVILLFIFLSACQQKAGTDKLMVSAAASTQFAVQHLAKSFEEQHHIPVEVVIGSSGKLTTQIINGAPFDVFISANTFYPNKLKQEHKLIQEPYVYGRGVPIIWSLDTTFDLNLIQEVLLSDKVVKIAIADPRNAPYGTKAEQYLKDLGIYNQIKSKLVFGESISQVNEYVLSQSVQIGFSAQSVLSSRKLKGRGVHKPLPEHYHIEQSIALIKNKQDNKRKELFMDFIKSDVGQYVLKQYGLL